MATVGSSAGVAAIKNGVVDLATAHLLEPARSTASRRNTQDLLPSDAVVVALFYRELGLLLPPDNPKRIKSIRDLVRPKLRLINRQTGSGTRIHLDQELARARLSAKHIAGYDDTVSTHMEAGLRVLAGEADVALATRTTAELLKLKFVSLTRERFDILVRKERFFTHGMQTLLSVVGSREFRERVGALGGYDVTESGRIVAAG
jgi:putative molybdopterin biosynthesis protein